MRINSAGGRWKNPIQFVLVIAMMWYYFFSSSFVLRPYPSAFWGLMAVISVLCGLFINYSLGKMELSMLGSLTVLLLLVPFSVDASASLSRYLYYIIYFLAALLLIQIANGKRILVVLLAFSAVHLICIAIQFFFPDIYIAVILPLLPVAKRNEILEAMNYNVSYYGFTVQTSAAALYLSIGGLASFVLYRTRKKQRILFLILSFAFIIGTFLTVRRGSTAALLVAITMCFLSKGTNKYTRFLVFPLVVIIIMLFGSDLIPGLGKILNKFSLLESTGDISNGRLQIWSRALAAFSERPILGYGAGSFSSVVGGSYAHNSYINSLVENGIVGTIFFFVPYIYYFRVTLGQYRASPAPGTWLSLRFFFQIMFFIMAFFESYFETPLTMFLYDVVALSTLTSSSQKEIDI